MKKYLIAIMACILSIALICAFASCGKDKKPAESTEVTEVAATSEVEPTEEVTEPVTDAVEETTPETNEGEVTEAPSTEG